MENEPQTPEPTRPSGNTVGAREPADSRRQTFAYEGSAAEKRVSEPAVDTDGQIVEAGYGHGV